MTAIQRAFGKRRGSQGFTLIELLVVVAIISLLIAILLPSLEAARRQAKKVACLSNLKGIGTSSRVYEADDPNGWGIPVHPLQFGQCANQDPCPGCASPSFIGAYEWGGKSGIGQTDYFTGTPGDPRNSKYGTRAGFGPASRPMNEILFGSGFTDFNSPSYNSIGGIADTKLELAIFRCPGDNGPPRGAHCEDWLLNRERSSYDHFGNSYAANIFMTASSGGGPMLSNSPYMRSVTRVPNPARTIYYEENIGRWAWAAKQDPCTFLQGVDPGPTKEIDGWHGQAWSFNRVFTDAHGEYQRIYFEGTEDAQGYAAHYRAEQLSEYPDFPGPNYCSTGLADGSDFNSMMCIIVRGDGWQKDTLPAAPILTGLNHDGSGRPSYEGCVEDSQ